MKKNRFLLWFFIFALLGAGSFTTGGALHAQTIVTLDEAIKIGATEIENGLSAGVKVVVLNFSSHSQRFSDYVLDELVTELVRGGKIIVVDRANLELIQQEMSFQMSGEVSDTSAQAIGQKLGAQSIISGSIENMGNYYRMRFRTIEVETARVQIMTPVNVNNDNRISILMGPGGAAPPPSTPAQATPAPAQQQPAPRAPAAAPAPGALRYSGGRKVGAGFLNLIVGLGSFTMGDWLGGLIVGGGQALGYIFMLSGWDEYYSYYDGYYTEPNALFYLGLGLDIGMYVYGFIRPFQYDRSLARKSASMAFGDNPLNHIAITPTFSNKSVKGLSLTYTAAF